MNRQASNLFYVHVESNHNGGGPVEMRCCRGRREPGQTLVAQRRWRRRRLTRRPGRSVAQRRKYEQCRLLTLAVNNLQGLLTRERTARTGRLAQVKAKVMVATLQRASPNADSVTVTRILRSELKEKIICELGSPEHTRRAVLRKAQFPSDPAFDARRRCCAALALAPAAFAS